MDINKKSLEEVFGSFRAEWLREKIYSFFNEPGYFSYLNLPKSCVLLGGRGSGKTTALKCMSYEGQYALNSYNRVCPKYVGFYIKVNTNTVTSFSGSGVSEEDWVKFFTHYINLTICEEIANYIIWRVEQLGCDNYEGIDFEKICRSLGVTPVRDVYSIRDCIDDARVKMELYINNLGPERPILSSRQTPITIFLSELKNIEGHSKTSFYIIFDEYENFLDYQQRIVNTLIKHGGENYFFKVGVRELGWRVHSTLGNDETLISPADYERIHIEETLKDTFVDFAREVCESRIRTHLQKEGASIRIEDIFTQLPVKDEASLLGVEARVRDIKGYIESLPQYEYLKELHDHELYVFYELNNGDFNSAIKELKAYAERKRTAIDRYDNYSYAFLFSIAKKGARIRKYYSGINTLALISSRNIRFFMQLLNECIRLHIEEGHSPTSPISPQTQTIAASAVGLTYLRELEGVSTQGAKLSKLILGMGRLFQIMAANPVGGKPECNQFDVTNSASPAYTNNDELDKLLSDAVMHLALVRTQGTKLMTEGDTRSWDYSPHPIFAPYFCYSHRRKRKLSIVDEDILALIDKPQLTIKKLLGRRSELAEETLPAQMSLFDAYFS